MNDIAFLFPGQGSQFSGMGKLLAETYEEARLTFAEADDALSFALSRICFEGPDEELKKTENTQPALLAVSVAAFRVLAGRGWQAGLMAGHSLGEYSALVASGVISFADALRLVRKRGLYMQAAVPAGVGAMAALLKLDETKLEAILAEASSADEIVTAANLNSPDQVVISGHAPAVSRAAELAKAAGAKRTVILPVSAPFHCPLMRPAQEQLRPDLQEVEFHDATVPIVNNWQARQVSSAADLREGLHQQIPNPVRWVETIRVMAHSGSRRFVEVGAGAVLTGLMRNIDSSLKAVKFGEPADLEKVEPFLSHAG